MLCCESKSWSHCAVVVTEQTTEAFAARDRLSGIAVAQASKLQVALPEPSVAICVPAWHAERREHSS
jgi:hypothetical protein